MRILVMPDSFKGSLSASAVADAIASGVRAGAPTAAIECIPLGDGGENTIASLAAPLQLQPVQVRVHGADGSMHASTYYRSADGQTVYLQAAEVVGYADYVRPGQSGLTLSTYGIGEILQSARQAGAQKAVLALGGSATTDGGIGMLQALGWQLPGLAAQQLASGADLASINALAAPADWKMTVTALVDVDNPLTGPRGAAAVFGPQKGLSIEEITVVDQELQRLYPHAVAAQAGSGAAGGLGAAVAGPLGGNLQSGIDYVLDVLKVDAKLKAADLLITGEGHLDDQSTHGKVLDGLLTRLRAVHGHAKTVALCGVVSHAGAQQLGLDLALAISPGNQTLAEQLAATADNLQYVALGVARLVNHE
jgi:glycerate kinase